MRLKSYQIVFFIDFGCPIYPAPDRGARTPFLFQRRRFFKSTVPSYNLLVCCILRPLSMTAKQFPTWKLPLWQTWCLFYNERPCLRLLLFFREGWRAGFLFNSAVASNPKCLRRIVKASLLATYGHCPGWVVLNLQSGVLIFRTTRRTKK